MSRRKRIWILTALLIWVGIVGSIGSSGAMAAAEAKFSDIQGHWAQSVIEQAVAKGYVKGYEDGTFRPDEPVTAAEFVTMMLFSLSSDGQTLSPEYVSKVNKYYKKYTLDDFFFDPKQDDMGTGAWYANYIRQARILGMFQSDQFYRDFETKLKREDVAYVAENVVNSMVEDGVHHTVMDQIYPQIKDMDRVSTNRTDMVAKSFYRGIMIGDEGGWFNPDRFVTRSEAVAVVERIHDKSLRKPYKIDFSIYPHAFAVSDVDGTGYEIIFDSEKARQTFQKAVEIVTSSGKFVVRNGELLFIFRDQESYDRHIERKQNYEKWGDPVTYDALLHVANTGVVDLSINAQEGHYDRVRGEVREFTKLLFGDNNDQFLALIDDVLKEKEKYKEEQTMQIGETKVIYDYGAGIEIVSFGIY